jgi:hypothetical protein
MLLLPHGRLRLRAFKVEREQAGEGVLGRDVLRPSIGGCDGAVERDGRACLAEVMVDRRLDIPIRQLAGGPASRSLRLSLPRPIPEADEIGVVSDRRRPRRRALEHQILQALPILVGADQLPDILAGSTVSASGDLVVDERFQRTRKRDVHRAHDRKSCSMARFGKMAHSWIRRGRALLGLSPSGLTRAR